MTAQAPLTLTLLKQTCAVCQLPPDHPIPTATRVGELHAVLCAPDEITVVCASEAAPSNAKIEDGWRALKLEGPFPFHLTGILRSVLEPLQAAGVSIFALSTFNTDYVLIAAKNLDRAVHALRAAGFAVNT